MRLMRPDRSNLIYESVFPVSRGWSPDPQMVAELRGPFIVEQRVIPDGLWIKVAEATDGFATLAWNGNGVAPVRYDIEMDLGIL